MDTLNNKVAARIVDDNRYMTLATCCNGDPWASPVAYVVDSKYNFYWYSAINSRHSINISANSVVSAAIFDSRALSDEVDGVQILGKASVVSGEMLANIMNLYWKKSFPDPQVRSCWARPAIDFTPPAKQRFYQLIPKEIYKVDTSSLLVDLRIPVKLE